MDYDGKSLQNPQYVADGGDGSRPSVPVRSGYTFTGFDGNWLNVKEDVVLNAKYREGLHKTFVLYYRGYSGNAGRLHICRLDKRKNYVNVKAGGDIYAYTTLENTIRIRLSLLAMMEKSV